MKTLRYVSWVCWIVGCALVFGQWIRLVPTPVAWVGFGIALAGWAAQFIPGYGRPRSSDELGRLASLRDRGVLTPDEFEEQKKRILGGPPG